MYSASTRTARPSDCTAVVPPIDRDFWSNRAQALWTQAADWDEVVTGLWSRRDAVVFALAHEMKEVTRHEQDAPVIGDLLPLAERLVLDL